MNADYLTALCSFLTLAVVALHYWNSKRATEAMEKLYDEVNKVTPGDGDDG